MTKSSSGQSKNSREQLAKSGRSYKRSGGYVSKTPVSEVVKKPPRSSAGAGSSSKTNRE